MKQLTHIAIVTPRYGSEVIGGAEFGARMIAENMAALLGVKVEILTTTALDTESWEPFYKAGNEVINDVTVRRFGLDSGRTSEFYSLSRKILKYPNSATMDECNRWIDSQGPISNGLMQAIDDSQADAILHFPYLYYPMVRGVPRTSNRSILIPAAHDEAPAYLPIFRQTFQAARGFVFQTRAEEKLVDSLFKVANKPRVRSGLGIEEYTKPIKPIEEMVPQLKDTPYLLVLGRVNQQKGATLLSELFAEYKRRNPSPLKLVFAGPVTTQPIEFPDILTLGEVGEDLKWTLLKYCMALANPSAFESFSIVLFEAWSQMRPVLVNSQCEVTTDHAIDSAGGLAFSDFAQFEAQVNLLYARPQLRNQLGFNGRKYAKNNYSWEVIVAKLENFLTSLI